MFSIKIKMKPIVFCPILSKNSSGVLPIRSERTQVDPPISHRFCKVFRGKSETKKNHCYIALSLLLLSFGLKTMLLIVSQRFDRNWAYHMWYFLSNNIISIKFGFPIVFSIKILYEKYRGSENILGIYMCSIFYPGQNSVEYDIFYQTVCFFPLI